MAINPEILNGNGKWERIRPVWNEIAPMIQESSRRSFREGFTGGIIVSVIVALIVWWI